MTNSLLLRPHRAHRAHRASVRACPRPRPLAIRVPTGQLPARHATPLVAVQMPRCRTPSLGRVVHEGVGRAMERVEVATVGEETAWLQGRTDSIAVATGVGHRGGRPPKGLRWIVSVDAAVGRKRAGGGSCGWLDGLMRCQGIWSKQGVGTKIGYPMLVRAVGRGSGGGATRGRGGGARVACEGS